jgi:PleD family two-component response regulator
MCSMVKSFRPVLLISKTRVTTNLRSYMQTHAPKRVLAVVSDLFFSVKLTDAAKRCGLALEFVKDPAELLEKAKEKPTLIVFDLNFDAMEPLKLIAKLKGQPATKGISLLGYVSHVQGELKQSAQEAGCDMVLARSAFSQSLTQIFKRHSGTV